MGKPQLLQLPSQYQKMNHISQKGEINPLDSLDTQSDGNGDAFKRKALVVSQLVNRNVLRYTSTGTLTWYGRPQKLEFGKTVTN